MGSIFNSSLPKTWSVDVLVNEKSHAIDFHLGGQDYGFFAEVFHVCEGVDFADDELVSHVGSWVGRSDDLTESLTSLSKDPRSSVASGETMQNSHSRVRFVLEQHATCKQSGSGVVDRHQRLPDHISPAPHASCDLRQPTQAQVM